MTQMQKNANMTTKLNYVTAIKALYPGAVDTARLVYAATPGALGAQQYEGYMGFVLGTKARQGFTMNRVKWAANKTAATGWSFYVYGYNGAGANNRVLWRCEGSPAWPLKPAGRGGPGRPRSLRDFLIRRQGAIFPIPNSANCDAARCSKRP
jgi:hypothetical protein